MNKNQIIKLIGFGFAFIFFGLVGCEVWATEVLLDADSVRLTIDYITAYPNRFVEIPVFMQNDVAISSFALHIMLGGRFELANFHTVATYLDSAWEPIDTCPDPDTVCTVDTCYWEPDSICKEWRYWLERECYLDTAGSLISDFVAITCDGDTLGNPSFPDWVEVYAFAGYDTSGALKFIPPRGNFDLLFTLGVDLFCLCDAVPDSDRKVLFMISPGFSDFSDNEGVSIPFEYDPEGVLSAWWSVPGDANNDSLVDAADLVLLINYLFAGGPGPCIPEAVDPDSSCEVDAADLVTLINYLFVADSPSPKRGCFCPQLQPAKRIDEDFELFEDLNLKPLLERR